MAQQQNETTQTHDTTCPITLENLGAGNQKKGLKNKEMRFRWAFIEIPEKLVKFYADIAEFLKKTKFSYYLAGYHVPEADSTVGKHIHIFVQWVQPRAQGASFLRQLCGAHLSPHENYNPGAMVRYIKCEDEKHKSEKVSSELIEEIGELKGNGKFPSMGEVEQMTKNERKNLGPQYKNIVKEANENDMAKEQYLNMIYNKKKQIEVLWLYGKGGKGKTQLGLLKLREERENGNDGGIITFDDSGMANLNSDVKNEPERIKILMFNEFRDSSLKFHHFLSYLLNEKPYRVLYDNIYFPNLEKIVITSSQKPDEIYLNVKEGKEQIERRITYVGTMEDWNFDEQEPMGLEIISGNEYFSKNRIPNELSM